MIDDILDADTQAKLAHITAKGWVRRERDHMIYYTNGALQRPNGGVHVTDPDAEMRAINAAYDEQVILEKVN